MACSSDFVQFIVDQCSGAGEIAVKKMMGDYCLYCDGILFGLICDNNLYIKMTDAGEAVLDEVVLRPPYPSARNHFYITDVDDRDYLEDIIRATVPELMTGKSKARRSAVNRQVPNSLDEVIALNIVCSQDLRTFFEQYLGKGFRFKVEFQNWLRENAGLTFRDAVEAYPTLLKQVYRRFGESAECE
jgi:TfoX/Sxy family transcriptional regulator of competence genes